MLLSRSCRPPFPRLARRLSTARPLVVDMHSHFLPATWPNFAKKFGGEDWPWLRHPNPSNGAAMPGGTYGYGHSCDAMLMQGTSDFRPVTRAAWDVTTRLADMDAAGIDVQLLSATPILFQWHRADAEAAAVAAHFNDAALEICASPDAHGRLRALCQVPLQSIDAACLEVERAMAAGHVGVQIGNHVGVRDLDDEGLVTFLGHCASIGAPVLVHPWDMANPDGRLEKYMMGWTVGMPLETHLSITTMILGGAFDRLPASLKLCFAHGGGAFAFLLGRLENAWHEREIAKGKSELPPSHYLDRFSVDSAVFDTRALRLLTETFGPSRVMLGSDYPFPLGEQRIGSLVRSADWLSDAEQSLVLGGNAASFFGIDAAGIASLQRPPLHIGGYGGLGAQQAAGAAGGGGGAADAVGASAAGVSPSAPRARKLPMQGQPPTAAGRPRALSTAAATSAAPEADEALVRNYIGGREASPPSGATLALVDQASGRTRGAVVASGAPEVGDAVEAALGAASAWAGTSHVERAAVLERAAALMEADVEAFAAAESADTGKPLSLARALDVPRAIANLRMFAGLVAHGDADAMRHGGGGDRARLDDALNYTVRKPVGVVGLVTPWNLPLYLLTWKLAPALAMGNTVVAKPSELTPTTATMLARVLERAGLPAGAFNVVHGTGAGAGSALCAHPDVRAVSFTGGTATGSVVAATVAPRFAKLSLELGGKNPLLVFADADFETTVAGAVRASFLNSGQICLCASRLLIEDDGAGFYERFVGAYTEAVKALAVGLPTDPATSIGPLVSAAQREKVRSMHAAAMEVPGATTLCGGPTDQRAVDAAAAHGEGHWWAPTVVEGLGMDATLAQEEAFGPLVTLHRFRGEEEAVAAANDVRYGLAASVWTSDVHRAHSVAARIDAGTVWINCWLHRQLHMPFGGVKASGVAREGGLHSLDFYSETSTLCLKLGDPTPPPFPGTVR